MKHNGVNWPIRRDFNRIKIAFKSVTEMRTFENSFIKSISSWNKYFFSIYKVANLEVVKNVIVSLHILIWEKTGIKNIEK